MPDEWLTPQQVAEVLDCSEKTVRTILRDGILSGEKVKGQWRVRADEVERILSVKSSAPVPGLRGPLPLAEVDPGIVEITVALSGVATAIAAILPGATGIAENLRLFVAFLSGVLAAFSAYGALWLFACYCFGRSSLLGLREIWALLTSPARVGPYWLTALGLLTWLVLSVLIGALALAR